MFTFSTALHSLDIANCQSFTTFDVTNSSPLVSLLANVSFSLYKKCSVRVRNIEYNQLYVHEGSVEVIADAQTFLVEIYVGHPNFNHKIKSLYRPDEKWKGHLPTDELYIQFTTYTRTTLRINVKINECRESCYQLQTPSIVPTSIINLPAQRDVKHCIDNFAVSFHIRSSYMISPCSVNFTIHNNPSVCITVSKSCCRDQFSCFVGTISIRTSLRMTIKRDIPKPWCLPWAMSEEHLVLTLNTKNVGPDAPCIVTVVTNTTERGSCVRPEVTSSPVSSKASGGNSVLVIVLTLIGAIVLIISSAIIVYVIVHMVRARKSTTEAEQYRVRYIPRPIERQFMTPPAYSDIDIATISRTSTPSGGSFIEAIDPSTRSNPSSLIVCQQTYDEPPPPYYE